VLNDHYDDARIGTDVFCVALFASVTAVRLFTA